ncbi:MAG: coenzyme F420-0:L-glutamate ligase, partial [Nitrososphaerales archaeon]
MKPPTPVQIFPFAGIDEVTKGADVGQLILKASQKSRLKIEAGDILVVTHKIISKAEGNVLDLDSITPSSFAKKSGRHLGKDPRQVEAILSESRRLVKMVRGLIIAETMHGFVCANAGVDQSNVDLGKIVLLPKNPDDSARKIRNEIKKSSGIDVAIIISDTFGRPWREGQVDVAIGLSGLEPFADYRGITDQYGYNLKATVICVADELASAAELCM